MKSKHLNLDDAPPLSTVVPYFFAAPVFVMLAGFLVLACHEDVFVSPWAPSTIALAHLGTLGLLLMVMIGALYQMAPVIAGANIPFARLSHVVHAFLVLGVLGFGASGLLSGGKALAHSGATVTVGITLFLVPAGWALARTKAKGFTVWGMRFALLSVLAAASMGYLMSRGYAGAAFPGDRATWIQFHLSLGLLGWVGGLIVAVSWQVVPMFYLSTPISARHQGAIFFAVAFSVLTLPLVVFAPSFFSGAPIVSEWEASKVATLLAAPAALAVWIGHPLVMGRAFSGRKRRRPDATLSFWKMGMLAGPFTLALAVLALRLDDPRFALAFGWLAIWAWAGAIVHGMLHRIVPFLVWFHGFADLVGKGHLPTTRSLLPDERTRLCLRLHGVTSLVGLLAILWPKVPLVMLTGVLLFGTGVFLLRALILVFTKAARARRVLEAAPPRSHEH